MPIIFSIPPFMESLSSLLIDDTLAFTDPSENPTNPEYAFFKGCLIKSGKTDFLNAS